MAADHQWFWQTGKDIYGPLTTAELEDLVERGQIRAEDRIRLDESDAWLPASEVRRMFEASPDQDRPATAAEAAARVLEQAAHQEIEGEAEAVSIGTAAATAVGKAARGSLDILAAFVRLAIFGRSSLKRVFNPRLTLALVVVILLAILFKNVRFSNAENRETHALLAEAWEEVQGMKNRRAAPAEWREFERETLDWLDPTLASLGESAVNHEMGFHPTALWSRSHLNAAMAEKSLIAAGSVLKEVIAEAQQPKTGASPARPKVYDSQGKLIPPLPERYVTEAAESRFAKHMNVAQGFLDGSLRSSDQLPTAKKAAASIDPWMVGIVIVDVLGAAAALTYWWQRRRRRMASSAA